MLAKHRVLALTLFGGRTAIHFNKYAKASSALLCCFVLLSQNVLARDVVNAPLSEVDFLGAFPGDNLSLLFIYDFGGKF